MAQEGVGTDQEGPRRRYRLRKCWCPPPLPGGLGAGMGLWKMPASLGIWASLMLPRAKPSWAPLAHSTAPPPPQHVQSLQVIPSPALA